MRVRIGSARLTNLGALICLAVIAASGCSEKAQGLSAPQDKYGSDAAYYLALLARQNGNEAEAIRLFTECASSGSGIAAARSKKEIEKTKKTNDADEAGKADDDSKEGKTIKESGTNETPEAIALLHECIAQKQYEKAYLYAKDAKQYILRGNITAAPIISDMGKAALYSAGGKANKAQEMDGIAKSVSCALDGGEAVYTAKFYAGRLYAMGKDIAHARSRFIEAANIALTSQQSDNALWYLLYSEMNASTDAMLKAFEDCHSKWYDASYFDDLMESLSQRLLSAGHYKSHANVCAALFADKKERPWAYTSCESAAQYAYIYARLVQEGFLAEGAEGLPSVQQAFEASLDGGAERYYKALAITHLLDGMNWREDDTAKAIFQTAMRVPKKKISIKSVGEKPINEKDINDAGERAQEDETENMKDTEKFLLGFVDFGLVCMIYGEWQNLVNDRDLYISEECTIRLADALYRAGNIEQCLRIASRTANHNSESAITRALLLCLFPLGYKDAIEAACHEFGVNEEYAFALVRSESFFNSEAKSTVGAAGLTQLMPSTARDTAKALKKSLGKDNITDEDILDPAVNIALGIKYLSDLTARMDGLPLLAFLSYNTGITRIRRYVKANNASAHPLPLDLLIETLPYQETRGYGRKLVSAAAMYGYLYYGKSVQSVVHDIFSSKQTVQEGEK